MSRHKFVFCEGGDDEAVIRGVAKSINLSDLKVEPLLGKDNLRQFLAVLKTRPEFAQDGVESIAIVRDADDSDAAAFQSVCDSLSDNGFSVPSSNGAVTADGIKVGVLIIGPNAGRGMIEDLCLQSVADRPEFGCVDEYFNCIAERSERKIFSSKAKIRVWMSSQKDFDVRVGKAAEYGYWPWDSSVFDQLKAFLRTL